MNVSCLYKAIDEEFKKIKPILPKNIIHAQIHQVSKTQRSLPYARQRGSLPHAQEICLTDTSSRGSS